MGVGGELASVKSGVRVVSGGEEREVRLAPGVAALGDRELPFREIRDGGGEELVALEVAGEIFPVRVARAGDRVFVWCAGTVWEFRQTPKESRPRAHAEGAGSNGIRLPRKNSATSWPVPITRETAHGTPVSVPLWR